MGRGCELVLNTPQLLVLQTVESLSNRHLLYNEAFCQGSGFVAKAAVQEVFTNKRWDGWLFSLSFNLSLFVIFALNSKYIKQMASGCSIVCLQSQSLKIQELRDEPEQHSELPPIPTKKRRRKSLDPGSRFSVFQSSV